MLISLFVWALQGSLILLSCIISQVCRYEPEIKKMFDFSAERTLQSVEESLKRLGLEYIDVIQVQKNLGALLATFPP